MFFRMWYAVQSVLHSSSNPRAGCPFQFGGQKFPLFSVFRNGEKGVYMLGGIIPFPYAQSMEYLPTFALKITQMLVHIPYMEHMGLFHTSGGELL